jgi:hypothetical protein
VEHKRSVEKGAGSQELRAKSNGSKDGARSKDSKLLQGPTFALSHFYTFRPLRLFIF